MSDVSTIPGINDDETKALRDHSVWSIEDFWATTAQKDGIETLAQKTEIEPQRLLALVAAQAVHEADEATRGWWARYGPETLLALLALALVLLVVRAAGGLAWLPEPWGLSRTALVAVRDLPAGHVLEAGDVQTAWLTGENAFQTVDEMESLVLTTAVGRGQRLHHEDTLSLDLSGLTVIALPLAGGTVGAALPGSYVDLLFAPPADQSGVETQRLSAIPLLAVDDTGEMSTLLVALTASQLEQVAPLAGKWSLFVLSVES